MINKLYSKYVLFETVDMQADFFYVAVAKIEPNQLVLLCPQDWNGWWIRDDVAEHPSTPMFILEKLSKDKSMFVRDTAREMLNHHLKSSKEK